MPTRGVNLRITNNSELFEKAIQEFLFLHMSIVFRHVESFDVLSGASPPMQSALKSSSAIVASHRDGNQGGLHQATAAVDLKIDQSR